MDEPKIDPVAYSDAELTGRAAEFSKRIAAHDPRTGNGADLVKDSVLLNAAYVELQDRKNSHIARRMAWLTALSAAAVAAALLASWLAYQAIGEVGKLQDEQRRLLRETPRKAAPAREDPPKAAKKAPGAQPMPAPSRNSGAGRPAQESSQPGSYQGDR